ncbi:MAG TPA: hypothetical protein VEI97_07690 [bacterium]|nr:hypothetical protein [bacterium]
MAAERTCWNCGAAVPGKVQFCPSCNSLQKGIAEEMLAEPRVRGTNSMGQFLTGLAILAVVVLAVIFMLGRRSPGPVPPGPEPSRTLQPGAPTPGTAPG